MRFVMIVLAVLIANGAAMADTTRNEKVAYIVDAVKYREQIIAFTEESIRKSIEDLSSQSGKEVDQNVQRIIAEETLAATDEITDDYIAEVIDLALKVYSDEEIDALYQFYKTPEGQSLGSKDPEFERQLFWIDTRYLDILLELLLPRIAQRLDQEGIE